MRGFPIPKPPAARQALRQHCSSTRHMSATAGRTAFVKISRMIGQSSTDKSSSRIDFWVADY